MFSSVRTQRAAAAAFALTTVFTASLAVMPSSAFAAKGAKGAAKAAVKAATKYKGKVTAIAPNTVSIDGKEAGAKTFTTFAATTYKVNHMKSTESAVKVGMQATVWSADGKTALQVHAHDKGAKKATPDADDAK